MPRKLRDIFSTIKTEGNLLPIDLLQRIVGGDNDLEGLSPDAYHLTKNERLNEIINRAWSRCEGAWRSFRSEAGRIPGSDVGTTVTRERWLLPLFQELGYGRLLTSKAREIDGKTYPISHNWHHTPIHLVSFRQDLDRRTPGVAGAARMSPHSLVQEFLNRSQDHLWGIVSNGLKLRLLRDNASLTRQAYVEFDLEGMMSGEVYSDFILLFMLLHQSRVEADRPEQCWLERWTQEAQKQGTRALDQLRGGVEQAIAALGQGFLAHPANTPLRQKLQSGELTTYNLYQQLLRLIYRMIFLFVAEDRNLLLTLNASAEARRLYLEYYSLSRIRRIAGRLRGTRHSDLWQGLRITFRCLVEGRQALGLNPLGGFLFSHGALADLNNCELSNEALLRAIRHLSYTQDHRTLRPVDYRNLGTEELGSVYESLLELHPEVNVSAYTFDLKITAGSERKTTGSYYTPTSLINCLLDSALEPVIERALTKPNPEKALLSLRVCDPACGSGHFLIAAAHRIAKHLAMIRTGEAEPAPEESRKALRDVVSHCIYGVDVNPLAVELCKVALWIETLDPGRPLGFLDHHIKCGNSLIGATPELLEKGIPDNAFKPVEGDDKKIAAAIRKKNKKERQGQKGLFVEITPEGDWQDAVEEFYEWGSMPEHSYHQVCDKAAQYETLQDRPAYRHEKEVADLWTAAFFWPLTQETGAAVPTEDIYRRFQTGDFELNEETGKRMRQLAAKHRFFHWHLEFPEVFVARPSGWGFNCVLGNPPWEQIELAEKEFFAQEDPEIARAPNSALRKQLILNLEGSNPSLWNKFVDAKRSIDCQTHFIRNSGKYPLNARGRINSYQIFAGLARELISEQGRAGIIIPSGIATDDSNKKFFADLTDKRALVSLYDFENREGIFPAVHRSYKFCLLTVGGTNAAPKGADFAFFLTNVTQLKEDDRHFSLSAEDIALLNPNTRTCPIFRSKRDAEITKAIYRRVPVLIDESKGENGNPWGITFKQGLFNMASDSRLFRTREQLEAEGWKLEGNIFVKDGERCLPLYEAKMVVAYDHRHANIEGKEIVKMSGVPARETTLDEHMNHAFSPMPRYWVTKEVVEERINSYGLEVNYFIVFRDVARSTDVRTAIFSVIPRVAVGHKAPIVIPQNSSDIGRCFLLGAFNSFIYDYIVRQKIGGASLSYFIVKQVPIPNVSYVSEDLRHLIVKGIIELTYTAHDIGIFAELVWNELNENCSIKIPLPEPFLWSEERRFLIRCELDAIYFHLYGVERDDVDYIMETFPIVKRKDEQKYGEYRTKRVILECYDAMAEAMRKGRPYQTVLSPPPADPRMTHPSKEILTSIVECFKSIYGEALVSVAHFGSRARGTFKSDSDYDFFVILENSASRNKKGEKSKLVAFDKLRDQPIHNHVIRKCELSYPANIIILADIKDSRSILYDKDSFLAKQLPKSPHILRRS
ncbi:MAG: N-6 DNA methylase [Deltaproteobacteria bacterium]|nr:N-6 DNA methylase [Deltaproteobacteria bacterium]